MLRHLYAAGTPHKNPATVFCRIRVNKKILRYASALFLNVPGKPFCDFSWLVYPPDMTNRKTLFCIPNSGFPSFLKSVVKSPLSGCYMRQHTSQ